MSYINSVDVIDINLNMVDYMKQHCENGVPDIADFVPQMYQYQDEIIRRIRESDSDYLSSDVKIQFGVPHLDMQLKELADMQIEYALSQMDHPCADDIFQLTESIYAMMSYVVCDLVLDNSLTLSFGMDYSKGVGYRCVMTAAKSAGLTELDQEFAHIIFYGSEEDCDVPNEIDVDIYEDTERMIPDDEPILTDARPSDFRKLKNISSYGEIMSSIKSCTANVYVVNMDEFPVDQYNGQDTDWGLDDALRDVSDISNELCEIKEADMGASIIFYGITNLAKKVLPDDAESDEVFELSRNIQQWLSEYVEQKRSEYQS